jgi:putative hydrolase of the HAD superfamily
MGTVPRALLLDVDDTLVDTRAAMVAAGGAAAAALWPHEPPEVHHRAGVHFHRDPGGWFRRYTAGEMAFDAMRAARVADLVTVLGLGPVDDAHRRFELAYQPAFRASLRLFGDVHALLEAARRSTVPVGLLTNSGARATTDKLEVLGLAGAFPVVATTDTLGFGKPHPQAFLHACERLGAEPARTAYVGDDLVVDALAARDAGLLGIWLDRGHRRDGADLGVPVVGSLGEVLGVLAGTADLGTRRTGR